MEVRLLSRIKRRIRRFLRLARKERGVYFAGHYGDWATAMRFARGYDAPEILERTRRAMHQVRSGSAKFERDSVIFDRLEPPFPLLAAFARVAAGNAGRLDVLDFGGALGSTYFQCREFLRPLRSLRWTVVEQSSHVKCGHREFASEELFFLESIEQCMARGRPDVLLLSGVLQYLPAPYDFLRDALSYGIAHVVLDRTAFARQIAEVLTIQYTPSSIYSASYPTWFLSQDKVEQTFAAAGYRNVCTFTALDTTQPDCCAADYLGMIYERAGGAATPTRE
jgi:putative methyltransferase (TIGR04325 family)